MEEKLVACYFEAKESKEKVTTPINSSAVFSLTYDVFW